MPLLLFVILFSDILLRVEDSLSWMPLELFVMVFPEMMLAEDE
jgi:hypothetical protein